MRTVPSLLNMLDEPDAATPVIMPWDYVRMRREASGQTIAQVAVPFYKRPEHREDVERNLRSLETVGIRWQYGADMSRAFPFSIDVYRQLADLPAHQHPKLCLRCGWDEFTTQYDTNGDDLTWSRDDPSICTRCEQNAAYRGA